MEKNIKVIPNFLSNGYFREITNILDNPDFGWFFQMNTVTGTKHLDNSPFFGFRHLFVAKSEINSSFGQYLMPFAWQIEDALDSPIKDVVNMYANMVLKKNKTLDDSEWHKLSAHIDGAMDLENSEYKRWTGLLYMDNADGDTVFFQKTKSGELIEIYRKSPVANTLVVFPSEIFHSPGLPYNSFMRRVLNVNLLVKRKK